MATKEEYIEKARYHISDKERDRRIAIMEEIIAEHPELTQQQIEAFWDGEIEKFNLHILKFLSIK